MSSWTTWLSTAPESHGLDGEQAPDDAALHTGLLPLAEPSRNLVQYLRQGCAERRRLALETAVADQIMEYIKCYNQLWAKPSNGLTLESH